MPKYTAVLSKKAQKQLDKLPDNIAEPIIEAILDLEENPRPVGNKKLIGVMVIVLELAITVLFTIFLIAY
jgi:mRNA-degrading endonuclease RelE of RelBE toxin-antitoxin system